MSHRILMFLITMSVCSRVVRNSIYFSILSNLIVIFLYLTFMVLKKPVFYWNYHFMLS